MHHRLAPNGMCHADGEYLVDQTYKRGRMTQRRVRPRGISHLVIRMTSSPDSNRSNTGQTFTRFGDFS